MKSKSGAATWPRTLDHIPEIYRSLFPILLLPLLLLCLLFSMGSLQKNRRHWQSVLRPLSCASIFSPTVIPEKTRT